jgi:hypothetical protein
MKAIALYAQALDNVSSDTMLDEESNQIVADQLRRSTLSKISTVTSEGKLVASGDGWKIFHHKDLLVAHITTSERDVLGRSAPVVCLLENGKTSEGADLQVSLGISLSKLNRKVDVQKINELFYHLSLYQKKSYQSGFSASLRSWFQRVMSLISKMMRGRNS